MAIHFGYGWAVFGRQAEEVGEAEGQAHFGRHRGAVGAGAQQPDVGGGVFGGAGAEGCEWVVVGEAVVQKAEQVADDFGVVADVELRARV